MLCLNQSSLVLCAFLAIATASAADPGAINAAAATQSNDASHCAGTPNDQHARIAELEQALDRDRALVLDLQQQIASLRKLDRSTPNPVFASAPGALDPEAANAEGLRLFAKGDAEGAVPLFRQAAQAGHTGAMINLAVAYLNGKGVPQDPRQAIGLLERASRQGSTIASENLGRMYQLALGVPFNRDHAIAWYLKAQQQGSTEADARIAQLRAMPLR